MTLKTSVDELTLVLQATVDDKIAIEKASDWIGKAETIITTFEGLAKFASIFGEKQTQTKAPAGYTTCYTYGDHSFYFALAYNPENLSMGIVCKFSAESLHYYLHKAKWQVYDFLQAVKSDEYEMRLSRVDLDVEFFDERFTVNSIYTKLKAKKLEVYLQKQQQGKIIFSKKNLHYRGFNKSGLVETLYINSPRSSVSCRIYDKQKEEIELNKSDLATALEHKWVRFEAVFKSDYAHNLTEKMLQLSTPKELSDLILNCWTQKFYFVQASDGKPAVYTQKMLAAMKDNSFKLYGRIPTDNDLLKRFKYLIKSSGTVSTLYKIWAVFGEENLENAVNYILDYVIDWQPNADCKQWLKYHTDDTRNSFKNFEEIRQKIDQ